MDEKEAYRLNVLKSYGILDTETEADYDNITFLAATICNTSLSGITLIDEFRQWFKSRIGIPYVESDLDHSFCAITIQRSNKVVVVPNIMEDTEYSKVGVLNGISEGGFYAGAAIRNEDGIALGSLCVLDYEPKTLSKEQIASLEILADQVSKLFELRKKYIQEVENNENLNLKYSELEQFASVISHDLKSPLNNITSLIEILKEENNGGLSEAALTYLEYIDISSKQLKSYVDGLLNYYKTDKLNLSVNEKIDVDVIVNDTIEMLGYGNAIQIKVTKKIPHFVSNQYAIEQILLNLIGNAVKYNDKSEVQIEIEFDETESHYCIAVKDNGVGIKKEDFDTIFVFFKTLDVKDRDGNYGTGIGLSSVKKILEKINGAVTIDSEIGVGTTFKVLLQK